jgi:hypothetical protein
MKSRPGWEGKLNIAAVPPHKEDIIPWKEFLIRQINKTGVHGGVEYYGDSRKYCRLSP